MEMESDSPDTTDGPEPDDFPLDVPGLSRIELEMVAWVVDKYGADAYLSVFEGR